MQQHCLAAGHKWTFGLADCQNQCSICHHCNGPHFFGVVESTAHAQAKPSVLEGSRVHLPHKLPCTSQICSLRRRPADLWLLASQRLLRPTCQPELRRHGWGHLVVLQHLSRRFADTAVVFETHGGEGSPGRVCRAPGPPSIPSSASCAALASGPAQEQQLLRQLQSLQGPH